MLDFLIIIGIDISPQCPTKSQESIGYGERTHSHTKRKKEKKNPRKCVHLFWGTRIKRAHSFWSSSRRVRERAIAVNPGKS